METRFQIRLRQKGKWSSGDRKFILEYYEDGELKETKTLPKPITLWNILRPPEKQSKTSSSDKETKEKEPQKFSHDLLSEQKKGEKTRTLTEEEAEKLWRLTK